MVNPKVNSPQYTVQVFLPMHTIQNNQKYLHFPKFSQMAPTIMVELYKLRVILVD